MKRRNFLVSGLLAGMGLTTSNLHAVPILLTGSSNGPLEPFYIPPSPDPLLAGPNGVGFRTKVRSNKTNLQYSCIEGIIGPKIMGPAPHVHKELDEIMFVQEGKVSVMVGDKVYEIAAGGWHMRPHGIIHTFWNGFDKPARFIDMYFNQDFENYLEEMFLRLIPGLLKEDIPLNSKVATEKIDKLNIRYGITMFNDQRQPIMDKYGLHE